MPTPVIKGTSAPVKQPLRIKWDPRSGYSEFVLYEATTIEALVGIGEQLKAQGIPFEITSDGTKATLTAELSRLAVQSETDEVPTDRWEVLGNDIQKDAYEHPSALALGDSVLNDIRKKIDNKDTSISIAAGDATELYQLLLRGTTHYTLGQYVLRLVRTVSDRYTKDLTDANVGYIYTTAQLIEEATDASLQSPMPLRMQNKLNNIEAPAAQAGYAWGWLKKPASEITAAGNKIEVTSEWWLEQWSTFLYATL